LKPNAFAKIRRALAPAGPLPSPFAPRKLTWKERLTGELEE